MKIATPFTNLFGLSLFLTSFGALGQPDPGCLTLYSDTTMLKSKLDLGNGNAGISKTYQSLQAKANEALEVTPTSVMDKDITPPSGDKHDYISQGPYWWLNPDTKDGLPYIRKDGEVNPEKLKFKDHAHMKALFANVDALSKVYFLSDKEQYAEKAIELIRMWFLNPATKMNPHLEYGQGIPGITKGRSIGIIETPGLTSIVDEICFLRNSKSWTAADEAGNQDWMSQYLTWLLQSDHGKKEAIHPNNHGTYYDVQAGALAIFTNRIDVLKDLMEKAKVRRFDSQLAANGEQPHETARTKGFSYSTMNLLGLFKIAILAEKAGIDYWHYENKNGATLQDGLDYLIPFALQEKELPFQQISPPHAERLLPHLWIAHKIYKEPRYLAAYNAIAGEKNEDDSALFY